LHNCGSIGELTVQKFSLKIKTTLILQQYAQYVSPYVETFAYCLLENHFHLLIHVRSEEEIEHVIGKTIDKPHNWHISKTFSSWLSHTRANNKMYD
jgi:hypothetical protein